MKSQRWVWIPIDAVLAIHDEQISEHGGIRGVRDLAVIDSALARPRNLVAYGKPDAAALAAAYAFGLCKNHGFLDGNKRTAYVVAETFLDLNGYAMGASDEEVVSTMLAVASGVMPEAELAKWFRSYVAEPSESGAR
ncbi:MAG TPA: type II toxin-antitoxin system death-on-curing family toxin [Terracidiphilus sp.]|nr:type II toxin-antitoxin system death-on-curing family toxin [Terracidiphilus sp.]